MPITTFRGESSVADLAKKLYSGLNPKRLQRAEAALLKANPQLGRLDRMRAGAVLSVPSVLGTKLKARSRSDDPLNEGADSLASSLEEYGQHLAGRHALHQENLKEQAALLKDKNLKQAIPNHPEGKQLLVQIAGTIDAEGGRAATDRERVEKAFKQLGKTLKSL